MRPFTSLVNICLLLPADIHSHADSSKPIPFDSSCQAGCNASCPDAVRQLVDGLSIHLYFGSPGKYIQIDGSWVLQACGHFKTYSVQFPAPSGFQWDPSRLWRTLARWGMSLFLPADIYSHPDSLKPIPFDPSRQVDSNASCPDAVQPLAEELSIPLYYCSLGTYFQIVGYGGLQACGRFETYTIGFPSASGL